MDFNEIRLHAQKHIEDHGYVQYTIGTITYVEGTNVCEVDAEAGEETLSLMIDNADGSLMNLDKRRHVQVGLVEQIPIHDSISADVSMYFELIPKPRLGSINTNLKSIEMVIDDDSLTAFRIRLPQPSIADYARAYKLANKFVNYLSVVVGIPISHKRPLLSSGKSATISTLSMTIDIARKRGLDEDLLLNMSEPSANAFYYFAKGHDAFQNNNFDQAIGWFYKIIEEDGSFIDESKKYKPLRHVVYHKKLDSPCAIDVLQQRFSLSVNNAGYLDFNSPDVQFKLYLACCDLYEVVKQKIIGIVNEYVNDFVS